MSSIFGVYLNPAELEWVRGKPKGFVRKLVQREMAADGRPSPTPERPMPLAVPERLPDKPCPRCGSLIGAGAVMHGKCGWKA